MSQPKFYRFQLSCHWKNLLLEGIKSILIHSNIFTYRVTCKLYLFSERGYNTDNLQSTNPYKPVIRECGFGPPYNISCNKISSGRLRCLVAVEDWCFRWKYYWRTSRQLHRMPYSSLARRKGDLQRFSFWYFVGRIFCWGTKIRYFFEVPKYPYFCFIQFLLDMIFAPFWHSGVVWWMIPHFKSRLIRLNFL